MLLPAERPPASDTFALYPLTLCDNLSQESLTKAWIIEGLLDVDKVKAALDRVVSKWPLLAARVEVVRRMRFQLRIPLGPLPAKYNAYFLTSTVSSTPLSRYISLPLAFFTKIPPVHLFKPKNSPTLANMKAYAKKSAPITHWHLTYFDYPGEQYTCLGVTYSHGVLDGIGFAMVMHALEAELSGKEWEVPPLPLPGLNENPCERLMEREVAKAKEVGERISYPNLSVGGTANFIAYLLRNFWYNLRNGVGDYNVVIPFSVHTKLAAEARKALEEEDATDVRPTSGDVITAWLMKAVYSERGSPDSLVGLQNVGSLRGEWAGELKLYPHNCVTVLRSNPISVHDLSTLPLHKIAYLLAKARSSSTRIPEAVALYELFSEAERRSGYLLPIHKEADQQFIMSNVSVARVSDLDFRSAGGGRVLCHYKCFPTPPFRVTNLVGNNGRLDNGDLIVNCVLDNHGARQVYLELGKLMDRLLD
ncbi:hypothetical protein CC2G_013792 [Coprinopsis cinerea AmutBmut pab1-1]|nr:hypothetical protein CC2G_013792 [Coprinopsis cinerea AmutBmut pab1-1]